MEFHIRHCRSAHPKQIVTVAVIALLAVTNAQSQNQEEFKQRISTFGKQQAQLSSRLENLRSMAEAPSLKFDQARALILALNFILIFDAFTSNVMQLAYIRDAMIDERDSLYVKGHLALSCKHLKEAGAQANSNLNQTLVSSTNSAISNELAITRDEIKTISATALCQ